MNYQDSETLKFQVSIESSNKGLRDPKESRIRKDINKNTKPSCIISLLAEGACPIWVSFFILAFFAIAFVVQNLESIHLYEEGKYRDWIPYDDVKDEVLLWKFENQTGRPSSDQSDIELNRVEIIYSADYILKYENL